MSVAYFHSFEPISVGFCCVFSVSSSGHLGVPAQGPPRPTRSRCAVTQGFLTTCFIRNLVEAVDSFLFLTHPGNAATVPLTVNLQINFPFVSLGTFWAFVIFFPTTVFDCALFPNFMDNSIDLQP